MRSRCTQWWLSALCIAWGAGCQAAVITAPGYLDSGEEPPPVDAEAIFLTEVQPLLDQRCGSCHTDIASAPVFLDPADPYASVIAYPGLVRLNDPTASTLLTKGAHDGPAWSTEQAAIIIEWIEVEAAARDDVDPDAVETEAVTVTDGALNRIRLDSLDRPGSSIQFYATQVALGLHLTDIQLVAGTGGAAISRPRFVMYDAAGGATLDQDRFSDTELRVSSGMTGDLASAVLLVDYPAEGTLAIRFDSVGPME